MIQRYDVAPWNDGKDAVSKADDGRYVLYADAEKWVGEEIAEKGEMITGLRENKLYLENDLALKVEEIAALKNEIAKACVIIAEGLKVVEELEGQIAGLKAEIKEQFEQGISIIHDQGAENVLLKEQIAKLKSLIDGASDLVEIYPAESPAQKEWRDNWLAKAREALK